MIRARAAARCCSIPDLLHFWLCGVTTSRVHERDDDAVLRSAHRSLGGRPPRAPRHPGRACFRRSSRPAHASVRCGRGSRGDGLRRADVVAVATHDTGSAVAAVPFLEAGSAYLSVGTWSLVGVESAQPADQRRVLRGQPDERGRRRRHLPAPAQRRRALAAGRMSSPLGRGGQRAHVRGARRARRGRAVLPRFDRSERRARSSSRRHAGAYPGVLPPRPASAEPDDPGEVVRCVLESLALKHAETVDVLAR